MSKEKRLITFEVEEELRRRAKVKAAQEGRSVSEVLRELLEEWLKDHEPKGKESPK